MANGAGEGTKGTGYGHSGATGQSWDVEAWQTAQVAGPGAGERPPPLLALSLLWRPHASSLPFRPSAALSLPFAARGGVPALRVTRPAAAAAPLPGGEGPTPRRPPQDQPLLQLDESTPSRVPSKQSSICSKLGRIRGRLSFRMAQCCRKSQKPGRLCTICSPRQLSGAPSFSCSTSDGECSGSRRLWPRHH